MKTIIAVLCFAALASCTTTERSAAVGGVGGAIVGGAVTGTAKGAVVGAAIGTVGGALIGASSRKGHCRYRDRHGRVYIARCPRRY